MKHVIIIAALIVSGAAAAHENGSTCSKVCTEKPRGHHVNAVSAPSGTRLVQFRISGMLTPNCPALLKSAVKRIDGVERVQASFDERSATVEYVEGKTSVAEIQRVIKDKTGFDAEVVGS